MAFPSTPINFSSSQQIVAQLKKYNLIIHTSFGVFDSSKFNLFDYSQAQIADLPSNGIIDKTQPAGSVSMAYNPKANTKIGASTLNTSYMVINIPYSCIEKITVKSKRNFLENQPQTN